MRIKTRLKKSGTEINVLAADPVLDAAAANIPEAPLEGESSAAAELRAGIEALRKATEHERQQAQPQQEEAPSLDAMRAAQIELWQQQGLPAQDAAFLKKHLEMVSYPALAQHAAAEVAAAGLTPGTEEFYCATAHRFSQHMDQVRRQNQDQNAAADATPEVEPDLSPMPASVAAAPHEGRVPEQPEPPPQPQPRARPMNYDRPTPPVDASAIVSAPVSRNVPGAAAFYDIPAASIRPTAEQRQIARASGISDVEYAKNLQRLEREKASGARQR